MGCLSIDNSLIYLKDNDSLITKLHSHYNINIIIILAFICPLLDIGLPHRLSKRGLFFAIYIH